MANGRAPGWATCWASPRGRPARGARGEIGGLAALAARKGPSLVLHEARHLYEVLSG